MSQCGFGYPQVLVIFFSETIFAVNIIVNFLILFRAVEVLIF